MSIVRDIEHEIYERQRASHVPSMVTAVRQLRHRPGAYEDNVLGVAVLHPHALTAPEMAISAEWTRRSDEAIAQIRAEHERIRRVMARGGAA